MIIEFFGPPCVGKTTLASAVTARLRERGHAVRLVLSYRPLEYPPASKVSHLSIPAPVRRLVRPIVESVVAAAQVADQNEMAAVASLMRLVASRNVVRSMRLRQYLLRLSRTWHEAAASDGIVLFDQAFVQAIASAMTTAGTTDPQRIAEALDSVPRADLVVQLRAPTDTVGMRLAERRRRQSRIDRLLDAWTNVESPQIFEEIYKLLLMRSRPVAYVESADYQLLGNGVDQVVDLIARNGNNSRFEAGHRARSWVG